MLVLKGARLTTQVLVGWVIVKPTTKTVPLNAVQDGVLTKDKVKEAISALEDRRLASILQRYIDLFRGIPKGLPPERWIDHVITLETDAKPYCGKIDRLSQLEKLELQKQITELLERGWIEPSVSPWGAPAM